MCIPYNMPVLSVMLCLYQITWNNIPVERVAEKARKSTLAYFIMPWHRHMSCFTGLLLWKPLVDSCYKDPVLTSLMTSLLLGWLSLWPNSRLNSVISLCTWHVLMWLPGSCTDLYFFSLNLFFPAHFVFVCDLFHIVPLLYVTWLRINSIYMKCHCDVYMILSNTVVYIIWRWNNHELSLCTFHFNFCIFFNWKSLFNDMDITHACSWEMNWQQLSIGSGNDFSPVWH